MTREEWIDILRETLRGDLPLSEVDNNLAYYQSYMDQQMRNRSQEEVLQELGDPRLIARTIIDTYQMQAGSGTDTWEQSRETYGSDGQEETLYEDPRESYSFHIKPVRWYHKALAVVVIGGVLALILAIGGLAIRILLRFGIPILCILLLISLFKKK